ncbi:uncharacterized protein B0P05DRAFT_448720, partial [Gilbertella persicaria]|uniref:uncharacterized protein n=1 Tax=Gilbertella persicaria TaxID=101096 RepID=UPI00221E571B
HARSSINKCKAHKPSKQQKFQEYTSTSVLKTNLNNICKSDKFVKKLQEAVSHVSQVVYAGAMFANYFLLHQLKNGQQSSTMSHSLYY